MDVGYEIHLCLCLWIANASDSQLGCWGRPGEPQAINFQLETKFSKSNDKLKIIAGFMDGKVLDEKEVSVIATLPSLDEARAKIVGILATPAQKLVSILLAPGSKIANLARAKSLKK